MRSTRTPIAVLALALALAPMPAVAQSTTRVSVNSNGVQGTKDSAHAAISGDGRFAAFVSLNANIVAGDNNSTYDVFVRDRSSGSTDCASLDPNGATGNAASSSIEAPSLSVDGRFVAFESWATNLVQGGPWQSGHVYLRDRQLGTTEMIDVNRSGSEGDSPGSDPSISADGRFVAFVSGASNLVSGDKNGTSDCFVRDRVAGTTRRISVDSSGAEADDQSFAVSISSDGQFVAFSSWATNLVPGDANGKPDVFVHDRSTGITECVSVDSSGAEVADGALYSQSISGNGRHVAFLSFSPILVSGDTNGVTDVFVHDRSTGVTERVSVDSSGAESDGESQFAPAISKDGRCVAFTSVADNLVAGDTNLHVDTFVHDRSTGVTELVSVDSAGSQGDADCVLPGISDDGQCVVFQSEATNLVSGDTNARYDAFARDRAAAGWANYGSGFPGTHGVPSFTAQSAPGLGTTVTLDLANSCQQPTSGLILAGLHQTTLHTNRGGDLLVAPSRVVPVSFSYGDDQFAWAIPFDVGIAGIAIELQALELDTGAAFGVSFTAGLELRLGF